MNSLNEQIRQRIVDNMKNAEALAIEHADDTKTCLVHLKERDRYTAMLAKADGHSIEGHTLADGLLGDLGVELVA